MGWDHLTEEQKARKAKGDEAWERNKGQWADPEKARAASRKGNETKKRKAEMKRKLANMQEFMSDSIAAATADNPEFMTNIINSLVKIAEDEKVNADIRLKALDRLNDMIGSQAPKRQEVKVEQKQMTPEEAEAVMKALEEDK